MRRPRSRARLLSHYADFLECLRGRPDLAGAYHRRAVALDPEDPEIRGRYAVYLETACGDYDGAEAEYLAGLASAPNHPDLLGNYADFLEHARADMDAAERYYRRALEVDPAHPNNLTNYATFLTEVRGQHDRAESLYQRALTVAPLHRNALFKYALFLTDVKRAYADAVKLYRVAHSLYPENAAIMANLAGALFLAGRTGEARTALRHALSHPALRRPSADAAECWFYQVVYGDPDERLPALAHLRQLLDAGVRSPGFRLEPHVAAAWAEGHPWRAWLGPLAAVLTGEAEPDELAGWAEWAKARPGDVH